MGRVTAPPQLAPAVAADMIAAFDPDRGQGPRLFDVVAAVWSEVSTNLAIARKHPKFVDAVVDRLAEILDQVGELDDRIDPHGRHGEVLAILLSAGLGFNPEASGREHLSGNLIAETYALIRRRDELAEIRSLRVRLALIEHSLAALAEVDQPDPIDPRPRWVGESKGCSPGRSASVAPAAANAPPTTFVALHSVDDAFGWAA